MVFDVICQEDNYRRNKNTDLMSSFLAANQSYISASGYKRDLANGHISRIYKKVFLVYYQKVNLPRGETQCFFATSNSLV